MNHLSPNRLVAQPAQIWSRNLVEWQNIVSVCQGSVTPAVFRGTFNECNGVMLWISDHRQMWYWVNKALGSVPDSALEHAWKCYLLFTLLSLSVLWAGRLAVIGAHLLSLWGHRCFSSLTLLTFSFCPLFSHHIPLFPASWADLLMIAS